MRFEPFNHRFTWAVVDQGGNFIAKVTLVGGERMIEIDNRAFNKDEWDNLKMFVDELIAAEGIG